MVYGAEQAKERRIPFALIPRERMNQNDALLPKRMGFDPTEAPAMNSAKTMFQVARMAGEAFCKSVKPPRAASSFPGFAITI